MAQMDPVTQVDPSKRKYFKIPYPDITCVKNPDKFN